MELLVVPPSYFDVVDTYNTRMRPNNPHGRPNTLRAWRQWSLMSEILQHDMHVKQLWVNPERGLADMAFACDPGLWIDDVFIPANFWAAPRQAEVGFFRKWFAAQGIREAVLPPDAYFEGGDCVLAGKTLLVGYGQNRTNIRGVEEVKKILLPLGITVIPIKRITEEYYHLNSVLTYLPSVDLLLYYPQAFDADTFAILTQNLPATQIDVVHDTEAMRHHPDFGGEYLYSYTLNAIEHQGTVLMPYCAPLLAEKLGRLGLCVIVPPDGSSEFERSGGSYRCLTMFHNVTT
ncbi:MAG: hypothetical protein Q7S28_02450 [bacterium]|nr:hypothetical protein [bacterium]